MRILLLLAILLLSGCATIIDDYNQLVRISSNLPEARVRVTDRYGSEIFKGITPCLTTLESSDGYFKRGKYMVYFDKPGYKHEFRKVGAGINPWYWGNIFFGGLVGWLIFDPASGAMWEMDESLSVVLSPEIKSKDSAYRIE